MSMMGRWCQVSPDLLARIKARPAVLDEILNADLNRRMAGMAVPESLRSMLAGGMQDLAAQLPSEHREAFLAQVRTMQRAMAGEKAAAPEGTGPSIDLEKAWHGVHFLLCGSAEPTDAIVSTAVMGGAEVGPDHGYGPVRYLTADQVAGVSAALEKVPVEQMRAAYDSKAMEAAQVYPEGWDEPERVDGWSSLS